MNFAPGDRDSITNSPYFYVSDCGRYTVTLPIGDEPIYLAYRRPEPGAKLPATLIGCFDSAKSAKAACESHAQSTPLT